MFCMTFGRFQFQIDVMDKERFNTTVVLSHVTPGPVYVLTSRAVLDVLTVLCSVKVQNNFAHSFYGRFQNYILFPVTMQQKYATVCGAIQVYTSCKSVESYF